MEDKIYHGSKTEGLKELKPRESTQLGSYLYGTTNPLVALYFTHRIGSLKMTFGISSKNGKNQFYIVERVPGALANFKKPSSLYVLDGKDFDYFNKDSFGREEVRTDKVQSVVEEIKIKDTLEELKKYVDSGELNIYTYDQKPSFIPEDDIDMLKVGFRLYLMGGKNEDRLKKLLTLYPQFEQEVNVLLENMMGLSIEESNKYLEIFCQENRQLNSEESKVSAKVH